MSRAGDPPYYMTGDRVGYAYSSHHHPPQRSSTPPSAGGGTFTDYEKERRWSPCVVLMSVLFTLLLLIVVVCLIIFFTVGPYQLSNSSAAVESSSRLYDSSDNFGAQKHFASAAAYKTPGHNDYISAGYVLTAVETGKYNICLFDTAYLAPNYKTLYAQQHIKTAQHLDIEKIIQRSDLKRRELVHPLKFQGYVQSLGVNEDCRVVLYDHGEKDVSLMTATFVWWAFKVYGHQKVSILNGGLRRWKTLNYELSSQIPDPPAEGNFIARWDPKYLVTYEDIVRNFQTQQYQLVDARTPDHYNGRTKHPLSSEPGRIRGAEINIPIRTLLDDSGALKPLTDLSVMFRTESKLSDAGKPSIVYCNTGLQSSLLYFAMLQANYPGRMYDGGWVEFSKRADKEFKVKS